MGDRSRKSLLWNVRMRGQDECDDAKNGRQKTPVTGSFCRSESSELECCGGVLGHVRIQESKTAKSSRHLKVVRTFESVEARFHSQPARSRLNISGRLMLHHGVQFGTIHVNQYA